MGPATASPERIRELIRAGMDVARLNFSHGSHADHQEVYDLVRTAAKESGRAVGVLGDLQGPKIRLGTFADGPVEWRTGEVVRITVEDVEGTHDRVSTTYKGLASDAKAGDRVIVMAGVPFRTPGSTNVVHVVRIMGDELKSYKASASG